MSERGVPVEVERTIANEHRNRRFNWAMLVVVAVTCAALAVGALVLYVKIDGKVSHIDAVTSKVRTVQMHNTKRSDCQNRTFNKILTVVNLFFEGDLNATTAPQKVVKCT